jgi:hypothetical protein
MSDPQQPPPTSGGVSMINLGEMSKPATVLIEKIADAVGGIYRPTQIRRIAAAEADAKLIHAQGDLEITELRQRTMARLLHEEDRNQANIESIVAQALPQVGPTAKSEDVADDWLTHFFDRSRLTSDGDMQSLWARILSGEANAPGSFSRRTVDYVSTFEKHDAELFTKLCGFCWQVGSPLTPLVFDIEDAIYKHAGFVFSHIIHLESLGLLRFEAIGGFNRTGMPSRVVVGYYDTRVRLDLPDGQTTIPIGHVMLTNAGAQLAPISGAGPVEGFLEYAMGKWSDLKPEIISPK